MSKEALTPEMFGKVYRQFETVQVFKCEVLFWISLVMWTQVFESKLLIGMQLKYGLSFCFTGISLGWKSKTQSTEFVWSGSFVLLFRLFPWELLLKLIILMKLTWKIARCFFHTRSWNPSSFHTSLPNLYNAFRSFDSSLDLVVQE